MAVAVPPAPAVGAKASIPEHVGENARALELQLDNEDLRLLDEQFPPPSGPAPLDLYSASAALPRLRGRVFAARDSLRGRRNFAIVYALGFSQTEMCLRLSLVNGSRRQPLQRSRSPSPARRAIRSSSDGQTYRKGIEDFSNTPSTAR
jgi:hypothetical protein